MAFNVRKGGEARSVEVTSGTKSGQLVVIGALVGIAEIDAVLSDDGKYYSTLAIEGIANLPCTGQPSLGDYVYSAETTTGTTVTATAGTAVKVGIVTHVRVNGVDSDVWFKLTPGAAA